MNDITSTAQDAIMNGDVETAMELEKDYNKKEREVLLYEWDFIVDNLDSYESRSLTDIIKSNHDKSLSFLLSKSKKNITCYICVSKNIISSYNAKNLSKELNTKFLVFYN